MLELATPRHTLDCAQVACSNPLGSLWVAILGSSMVFIDGTVVNVALPVIQRELAATVTTMQWVAEAYALFLASLVLVGGALGDRFGRRRVFSLGTIVFATASCACGLAPTPWALVVARGAQGIGGALLVPGSLALISAAYDQRTRGAAIGTWSAASAITSAIGPVAGGWLVDHTSWRWLFLLNLPVAVITLICAQRWVTESRDDQAPARMDWSGTVLIALGLGCVVYGLLSSEGRASWQTLSALALGAALLITFVFVEASTTNPLVPLSLFRSRTFSGANLLTLLLYAALGAGMFFIPFDLIQVQGFAPAAAGAALLPMVLIIFFLSRWSGELAARYGARLPLVIGPLLAALGFVLLAWPGRDARYWSGFFPGVLALGLGMGVTVAPLTAAVMGAVDARHAGVASGINNAVARAAGLLAIAVLGLVLVWRFDAVLSAALTRLPLTADVLAAANAQRDKLAAPDLSWAAADQRTLLRQAFADAFVAGFRALMFVCAALALLGAFASAWLIERRPATTS